MMLKISRRGMSELKMSSVNVGLTLLVVVAYGIYTPQGVKNPEGFSSPTSARSQPIFDGMTLCDK